MTNSGPKMNQKAHGRPHGEATNQTRQKLILLHYSYKSIFDALATFEITLLLIKPMKY